MLVFMGGVECFVAARFINGSRSVGSAPAAHSWWEGSNGHMMVGRTQAWEARERCVHVSDGTRQGKFVH
jgi:hypothetical protein